MTSFEYIRGPAAADRPNQLVRTETIPVPRELHRVDMLREHRQMINASDPKVAASRQGSDEPIVNSSDDTETEKRGGVGRGPSSGLPYLFVVLAGDAPLVGGGRCSLAGIDEVVCSRSELLSMHRLHARLN